MAKDYKIELEGMFEFYKYIGLEKEIEYIVNSDGIYYGVLFEHKLFIDAIGKVLFQAIKYASKLRLLGKLIPEKIIVNDLNREVAYIFNSKDYLKYIEKVYVGAASKNNDGFDYLDNYETIYYNSFDGKIKLMNLINKAKEDKNYTKYHVDFTNILQLSREFYKHVNDKDAFINGPDCEIRKPKVLADRILPYKKESNNEFSHIMDCLNTKQQQKDNGAFYTPDPYVKLSQKMLLDRIEKIKEMGLDYIVIDRCAGTGNLFRGLPDDVLSHCILSTLEINEYLLLQDEFENKSTIVVPPTDALAYDIIPTEVNGDGEIISDYIREKIEDPNCAIILYENPPFAEAGGQNSDNKKDVKMKWKNSFVMNEMKNETIGDNCKEKKYKGSILNDLSNLFIWSAFKYYLKNPYDSYIVYSPIKYWKQQNLVNKTLLDSFICNRNHFHASEGAILCCHWMNKDSNIIKFNSDAYNIVDEKELVCDKKNIIVSKVYNLLSKSYDKRKFDDDEKGIISALDGSELNKQNKIRITPIENKNIIGYLKSESFNLDSLSTSITRCPLYNGNGMYLRLDKYLEFLPLFVSASSGEYLNWYEKGLLCKTYDGNGSYLKDSEFIKKCFIYTCLSFRNKCRSLDGSDGRLYKNELCFDNGTVASKDLKGFALTEEEKDLINSYNDLLEKIKNCDEYNPDFSYGTFQIQEEINIDIKSGIKDKKGKEKTIKKYPKLDEKLDSLKRKLKDYYKNNIYNDLFKYELLK